MPIDNNIAAAQPRIFQPLPREAIQRPIADFTAKSRPAAQNSLEQPPVEPARTRETYQTPPPLPPAPLFTRTVEREISVPAAVRAAADAPKPRTPETPAPTGPAAVPIRLNELMQEARGREVAANIRQAGGLQIAEPTPQIAPSRASLEQAPVAPAQALEPAATTVVARPRFQAMAEVTQEIAQLNARQSMQTAVRDRGIAENAGAERVRASRTIIDQRV